MVYMIFAFILGTIIGSFLNVVILRLPNNENLKGRSHCINCGKTLGPLDMVPMLSFLWLRGKCRYCGQKISPRYFIIELIVGLLFMFCWFYIKPVDTFTYLLFIKYCLILAVLVVVFVVDLEHYLILDEVIFPAALLVILLNLTLNIVSHQRISGLDGYLLSGLLASVCSALPFFLLWFFSNGAWMGFGDVKLSVFLGLSLGWPVIVVGLFVAILLGGIAAIFLLTIGSKTLKSKVPFGTFLSLGAFLALFYGEKLLHWYLAIIGF
jgi:leader peptidase (prepilin peptidase) / N-methyltransferase